MNTKVYTYIYIYIVYNYIYIYIIAASPPRFAAGLGARWMKRSVMGYLQKSWVCNGKIWDSYRYYKDFYG